jgi:hypothetical protein
MGKDPNERPDKLDAGERIDRELSQSCSNLWGAIRDVRSSGLYALYLRRKQGGVWTAVAKRASPDDPAAYVAFGAGTTPGKALAALNKSIMQGHWKKDMPWSPLGT